MAVHGYTFGLITLYMNMYKVTKAARLRGEIMLQYKIDPKKYLQ